jgi:hypothetical protein
MTHSDSNNVRFVNAIHGEFKDSGEVVGVWAAWRTETEGLYHCYVEWKPLDGETQVRDFELRHQAPADTLSLASNVMAKALTTEVREYV